jgi:hypothetical protein
VKNIVFPEHLLGDLNGFFSKKQSLSEAYFLNTFVIYFRTEALQMLGFLRRLFLELVFIEAPSFILRFAGAPLNQFFLLEFSRDCFWNDRTHYVTIYSVTRETLQFLSRLREMRVARVWGTGVLGRTSGAERNVRAKAGAGGAWGAQRQHGPSPGGEGEET